MDSIVENLTWAKVKHIRQHFRDELKKEIFTIDKTGQKTIEMIGASFVADESAIFGTPNREYIDAEIDWYNSRSTNINEIFGITKAPPQAWQYSANKFGEINSNYGHLIFSEKFHNQYLHVVEELINNPDSRRAAMIYNRPSIWLEYNEDGKNDFICTNAVTYYIRNRRLDAVVQMRSNDVVYGYKNDYAWQQYVMKQLIEDINVQRPDDDQVFKGFMHWQVQNLHVYERHFDLVQ
tara:strand:- start:1204 stop:1911 length:708 start_codon:yes stop_codon:yes gene_type:complete